MTMIATLDYIQDVLSGLNVRAYNYLDPDYTPETELPKGWRKRGGYDGDDRFDPVQVPFAVTVYDEGLDYDAEGNAYFDDYPSDVEHSFHTTRKGAEAEAAWLEHQGTPAWRIRIVEDHWTFKWELKYHPIRED